MEYLDLNISNFQDTSIGSYGTTNGLGPPTPSSPSPLQNFPAFPEAETTFSTSTEFSPHKSWKSLSPDVFFSSSDYVLFYVHSQLILAASDNQFHSLITHPCDSVIAVPDPSQILDVILRQLYNTPPRQFSASLEVLISAVERLPFYGISIKKSVVAHSPLHSSLLSYAPIFPIEIYTLAAKHDLLDLAIPVSSHLLSFDLFSLAEERTKEMGAIYLRKLLFLHVGRIEALKNIHVALAIKDI
ncbi:hypothetical protein D9757_009176 [Collybiopsis confluens]|uniref:BTB domain-containing protein n=1 Tax=Collybiopsis confluens TaxID=2823264 RepID=A0A8H5H7L2_9AGAR|nr:hypothetical protein D9757_009176 [Collybiopsis confluens]